MISLAGRDILHSWSKFVLTGIGLGLLIGVTLTMAGVYRGMVDDARALLNNSGADLWVVQQDTQGPYAESSSIRDDAVRGVLTEPNLPLRLFDPIMEAYGREPVPTAFGVSQAITLAAQRFSPEERLQLEQAAGEYLRNPD